MLHQQDQALPKSLLTIWKAIKEMLGVPKFCQRTCLVTLRNLNKT